MTLPRAVAVVALVVGSAACGREATAERCPGHAVATLAFTGDASTPPPLLPGEDPLPACTGVPENVAFTATIALGEDGATAALCTSRAYSAAARGTRSGDAIDVSTVTARAVLSQCADTCVVEVRERVAGTLLPSADAPERFEGAVVDTVYPSGTSSLCGSCSVPCSARYAITGVEPGSSLSSPAASGTP